MTNLNFNSFSHTVLLWLSVLTLAQFPVHTEAQVTNAPSIATLYSLEGSAQHRVAGGPAWTDCSQGQAFNFGDEVRVGSDSRAGIQFSDGLFIRLGSKATLRFDQKSRPGLFLGSGKAHFFNRSGEAPQIETAIVSAAIRGTEFVVDAQANTTSIAVIEGVVEASNTFGSVVANAGEEAITDRGSAPRKALLISGADAVQWTAEIPVIFDWDLYSHELSSNDSQLLAKAKKMVSEGNYRAALQIIGGNKSASLTLLRADLLFTIGQVDEASRVINGANLPSDALAHTEASQALMLLARNSRRDARAKISSAQAKDSDSPSVALAASYIAQADKNLEEARDILRNSVAKNSHEPLLLARLAEIELGFNNLDEARRLVNLSLVENPNESYSLTVLGFINLFEKDTSAAKDLFTRAARDSGSGLPLLGLGLSKIYEGDLSAGKTDIARAVNLEPSRAIFRSYLGKAFFELDEEKRAIKEYEEAIRLDPNDPTPWLYRGFANLSRNNVVGALEDVEKSFALNDDRAVFRSSLLLDEDLAVRSAGLSRIFSELGFEERGRIEAISALGKDMSNFSAHRLLGDLEKEIFFADASFSEHRVADLLAPLSFNLFSGLGGNASLNQYDALFDKSERRTAIALGYDQRFDRFSTEINYSGKTEELGYAMSASSDLADGSKSKNWERDYRLNGALRYQLAPKHRLLLDAHGAYQKVEDDTSLPQEIRFERGGGGIGYSYLLDSHSTILAEATAARDVAQSNATDDLRPALSTQLLSEGQDTAETELLLDPKLDEYVTAVRGGMQWIYRNDALSAVSGFQILHEDANRYEHSVITDDALQEFTDKGVEVTSTQTDGLNASDFYLYPTWHALRELDITAGVVRTDIDRELVELPPFIDQTDSEGRWNPKVGITFAPVRDLTLRSAYFESLRKSSLEDQVSIEPTLVGGITQRFNDLSGTSSRNLGFGADYKFGQNTYVGGEYIRRNLTEPGNLTSTEVITDTVGGAYSSRVNNDLAFDNHVKQDFARGYVYQVLSPTLVASFDYRYGTDELTDPEAGSDFLMHRCSAQLKYFHSSGMFGFTRATWRKQQGINDDELQDGKEIAWIFDAGVGYRLPRRRGTVTLELFNIGDEHFDFDQSKGFDQIVSPDLGIRLVAAINF